MTSPTSAAPVLLRARGRVWDTPLRIFHWLLVLAVSGALVTVQLGGLYMDWHVRCGQLTLALLLFRVVWGFYGPRTARFCQFLRGPTALLAYVRGQWAAQPGHNPLGGWAVLAMLLVLGLQAVTGLFANDDILTAGPLAGLVSAQTSSWLTWLHGANGLTVYIVLALHLLAVIVWYTLIRRRGIILPMLTGDTELPAGSPATEDNARVWLRALVVAALAGAVLWAIQQAPPVASAYY